MRPALILSPHFDDAVLSCGQLMAGRPNVTVATVFNRVPDELADGLTQYDKDCGFKTSGDAVRMRKYEDEKALDILEANQFCLDFIDGQYLDSYRPTEQYIQIRDRIRNLVKHLRPEFVVAPVGILHPDHLALRDVAFNLSVNVPIYLYEEIPYYVQHPRSGAIYPDAMDKVFIGDGPKEKKMAAIKQYKSQLWAIDLDCCLVPERYWRFK